MITEDVFWVSSYPYFDSTLLVVPGEPETSAGDCSSESNAVAGDRGATEQRASVGEPSSNTLIKVFDPEGEQINEALFTFPAGEAGVIELGPLLGGCRLQYGLKHARIAVASGAGARHMLRIRNQSSGTFLSPGVPVRFRCPALFPLNLGQKRMSLVSLMNATDESLKMRCRLFIGKRTPEIKMEVPARGVKLFCIEDTFQHLVPLPHQTSAQAYLRVSCESVGGGSAQLLERNFTSEDKEFFVAV